MVIFTHILRSDIMTWEDILKRKRRREPDPKDYGFKPYTEEKRLEDEKKRKEYEAKVDRERRIKEMQKKKEEEMNRRYEEKEKEQERLGKIHGLYECMDCANKIINYDNLKIDDLVCNVCGAKKGDSWRAPFIHRIKGEKEE
jgi:hypothetical protein